jgi:hypothetical protein
VSKAKRKRPAARPQPAAAPKKPIGKWIAYGVAGVVVIGLVAIIANPPEEFPDEPPPGAEEVAVGAPTHVEGPIDYDREVPAGGQHNPIPVACTIYDQPLPPENVVHSLEHGAVWITYQNEDAVNLGSLERLARSRSKVILSPVPTQTSPIMATAWGWQLELHDAGDTRLPQFIQAVQGDFSKAPESGASC